MERWDRVSALSVAAKSGYHDFINVYTDVFNEAKIDDMVLIDSALLGERAPSITTPLWKLYEAVRLRQGSDNERDSERSTEVAGEV